MRKLLLILIALFLPAASQASCPALPYNLTNGTTADATQVMANFNTLLACSTGATFRDYIGGFTLSNDSTTPNTVLDVGAGQAADSTNAVPIATSGTYFKSMGSAWLAGAGSSASPVGGMGSGLTMTASTWYHVFAIINVGASDVYFDTSVTAAHAPAGTTYFRRLGSIYVNSSTHISAFKQVGNDFTWSTAIADVQAPSSQPVPGYSGRTLYSLTVPTGVQVIAKYSMETTSAASSAIAVLMTSPDETDQSVVAGLVSVGVAAVSGVVQDGAGEFQTRTNLSGQVGGRSYNMLTPASFFILTRGWCDYRGQNF